MSESELREALHRLASQAAPARLPEDLWRRARRRHRRRMVTAIVAVVLAGTVAVSLLQDVSTSRGLPPAAPGPAVPATVYPPVPGERTVLSAPPGPAAILVMSDEGAFSGSDVSWHGYEARNLVVGRNGRYRLLRERYGGGMLTLSPDGRYVAGTTMMEGAGWSEGDVVAVLDLSTGEVRRYRGGTPVGTWAPDGRHLLLWHHDSRQLRLLDLDSGTVRDLMLIGDQRMRGVAFAPDGERIAVQADDTLHVIDLRDGSQRELLDLGTRTRLAGVGAWLPDNRTVAVLDMAGCETDCDTRALNARVHHVRYVDADSGARVDGPRLDGIVGVGAQLLGWQDDGDAVVTRHDARDGVHNGPLRATWDGTEWSIVRNVELLALHPGGGQTRLVDLPDGALSVDVPRDLIRAGAFGGPSASRVEGYVRVALGAVSPVLVVLWPLLIPLVLALIPICLTAVTSAHRRFRRTRPVDPSVPCR